MNIDFDDMAKKDFWNCQRIIPQIMRETKDKQKDHDHYIYINDLPLIQQKGERGTKMNTKMFCGAAAKSVVAEERTVLGVASSDAMDRDREIIAKGAWRDGLDSYRKNPVLMLSHIYSGVEGLPIGRCLWIKEDSDGLKFKARFAREGVNPVADVVAGLYQDQVMNAFSVGFLPIEFEDHVENSTKLYEPLRTYKRCQLLEISCVAIPSNSEAIVQSAIKAYKAKANEVKPNKRIIPRTILDRDLYEDNLIEIDDRDMEVILRGFSRMPEMVTDETNKFFAEHSASMAKQIGDYTSLLIRKAQGKAF